VPRSLFRHFIQLLLVLLALGLPPSLPTWSHTQSIAEAGKRSGSVHVRGYYRKDGTYVRPHYRSAPDGNFNNNWSTKGNVNPYTGEPGTKTAPPSDYGTDVFVEGYYRKDGTYVPPHYRSAPDGDPSNNWSSEGNVNPYTGTVGRRAAVTWLQGALGRAGEAPGPIDGILGPRTVQALESFARKQGTQDQPVEVTWRRLEKYLDELETKAQPEPQATADPNSGSSSSSLASRWVTFTVGSTALEVLTAQGQPDVSTKIGWRYGSSIVHFDENGRVTGWTKGSEPLKTR
jgi:hypothetical protein